MTAKRKWELGSIAVMLLVLLAIGAAALRQCYLDAELARELEDVNGRSDFLKDGSVPSIQKAAALYRHGASVRALDSSGHTLLHWAAAAGDASLVEDLIRHGTDPNSRDKFQRTPLFYAVEHASVDVTRCLLDHGADVHTRCNTGDTPLHYASYNSRVDSRRSEGRTALVELLLQHHAEIEAKNEVGDTPLIAAIQWGEAAAVRPLLNAGARADLRDGDGMPLMTLARKTLADSEVSATIVDENQAGAKARVPGLKEIIRLLSSIPGSTHPTEAAPSVEGISQKSVEP